MENKKQTAVDWLYETLWKQTDFSLPSNILDKAKEMERQQIIEARQDGYESTYNSCESGCMGKEILEGSNEQYYTDTYGS